MLELRNVNLIGPARLLGAGVSATPSSGNVNNLAIAGYGRVKVTGASADWNLTGIATPASNAAGAFVIVINGTSYTMTIKAEDANSSASYRILPADVAIASGGSALLVYDDDASRWVYVSGTALGTTGLDDPSASVGLTAVNGSAATAMRSDAAPPIDQAITPTWTGDHLCSNMSPRADDTYNLGDSSTYWHNVYSRIFEQRRGTSASAQAAGGLRLVTTSAATSNAAYKNSPHILFQSSIYNSGAVDKYFFIEEQGNGNAGEYLLDFSSGDQSGILQLRGDTKAVKIGNLSGTFLPYTDSSGFLADSPVVRESSTQVRCEKVRVGTGGSNEPLLYRAVFGGLAYLDLRDSSTTTNQAGVVVGHIGVQSTDSSTDPVEITPNSVNLPANGYVAFQSGSTPVPIIIAGIGSPEGVVTADKGSLFLRGDGGAGTCLYVKESGTGNTGWVAK